jgi:hypothetical protein
MEEKKKEKKPRQLKVFREGFVGAPPVRVQQGHYERGFPTKAEFKKLFSKHERLVSRHPDFKGYEFAAATHKPFAQKEWVKDQVAAHASKPSEAMGVWCKLPRGQKKGQDAVPGAGTTFSLYEIRGTTAKKVMEAIVLYSSERLSRNERGVAFLVIGNAIDF